MNKITSILLLLATLISCQNKTESNQNREAASALVQDSLRSELEVIHQQGFINGFGVAIANENGVLYAEGFGYADLEKETKYTRNTIQNIGSVSKTLIGVALLKAQEQGHIQLDDPINDHLPFEIRNPTFPEEEITIRHLATHTSTILDTDSYDNKAYVLKDELEHSEQLAEISETLNPPQSKISLMAFLENMLSEDGQWFDPEVFSENRPGEIYEYSNVGAALAAAVIEEATGVKYYEFTTKHILEPLQMTSSGWRFEDIQLSGHSTLYADPKTEIPLYSLITYPDGGLLTTALDLGKYLSELIKAYAGEGTLLKNDSYAELFRIQLADENYMERDEEDDFHVIPVSRPGRVFLGYSPTGYIGNIGGDPGIATFMFFNSETKTGRILMINTTVRNSDGVDQFYAIWNKLGDYEEQFSANALN